MPRLRLPQLDWRRAISEVALIFLGITLALLFDNWNEERKERVLERQILSEIRQDLVETRRDLESDIANAKRRLRNWRDLAATLAAGEPLDEAWVAQLWDTRGSSVLFSKTSGYRALTSHGLDIVSDAETRKAITDFFELRLGRVELFESLASRQYRDVYHPFMRRVTRIPDDAVAEAVGDPAQLAATSRYQLRDAARLGADPELLHMFFDMSSATRTVLGRYEEALVDLDRLVAKIDAQLERDL